jgi:hypothetical protein
MYTDTVKIGIPSCGYPSNQPVRIVIDLGISNDQALESIAKRCVLMKLSS